MLKLILKLAAVVIGASILSDLASKTILDNYKHDLEENKAQEQED